MERVIKDINGKVVENAFEKAQYYATKMDMSVEAVISTMENSDCDYDTNSEEDEGISVAFHNKEEGAIEEGMFIAPIEVETKEEDIEELKEINKRLILEGFEKDLKIEVLKKDLEDWEDIEEADNPPTPEGVMDFIGEMKAHIANVGSENKKLREENEMLKEDMESLDAQNEEKYEKIEELNEEKKELADELVKALETIIHIKKKGESMCKSWEYIKERTAEGEPPM